MGNTINTLPHDIINYILLYIDSYHHPQFREVCKRLRSVITHRQDYELFLSAAQVNDLRLMKWFHIRKYPLIVELAHVIQLRGDNKTLEVMSDFAVDTFSYDFLHFSYDVHSSANKMVNARIRYDSSIVSQKRLDLIEKGNIFVHSSVFYEAVARGDTGIVTFMMCAMTDMHLREASRLACAQGHINILELLESAPNKIILNARHHRIAAEYGQFTTLRWLVEHNVDISDEAYKAAASYNPAVAVPNVRRYLMVKYLCELPVEKKPKGWENELCESAAAAGNNQLLEYLLSLGLKLTKSVFSAAALAVDNIETLRWLIDRGCPLSDYVVIPSSLADDEKYYDTCLFLIAVGIPFIKPYMVGKNIVKRIETLMYVLYNFHCRSPFLIVIKNGEKNGVDSILRWPVDGIKNIDKMLKKKLLVEDIAEKLGYPDVVVEIEDIRWREKCA